MRKSCESHAKVIINSWKNFKWNWKMLWESHEKVLRKSWESLENVMIKSWGSHEKFNSIPVSDLADMFDLSAQIDGQSSPEWGAIWPSTMASLSGKVWTLAAKTSVYSGEVDQSNPLSLIFVCCDQLTTHIIKCWCFHNFGSVGILSRYGIKSQVYTWIRLW